MELSGLFSGIILSQVQGAVSAVISSVVGSKVQEKLDEFGKKTRSHLRQRLGNRPPTAQQNQHLQQALCLAYCRAGMHWVADLNKIPTSELSEGDLQLLAPFTQAIKNNLSQLERIAYSAAPIAPETDSFTDQQAIQSLLTAIPEINTRSEIDQSVVKELTQRLEAGFLQWLQQLQQSEGEAWEWPEFALQLLQTNINSSHNSLLGQHVIDHFFTILKNGEFTEATLAFQFCQDAEILATLAELKANLSDAGIASGEISLAFNNINQQLDGIGLSIAQITQSVDDVKIITERIERRQILETTLRLNRRPAVAGDYEPFLQMIFSQRATAFVGRQQELSLLSAFLHENDSSSFTWWQIAGTGGQGKSRLALQLIDQLGPDWDAGFLDATELEQTDWSRVAFPKPTLCVIDYAAAPEKAKQVIKVIKQLQQRTAANQSAVLSAKVRVLVLERAGYDFTELATDNREAKPIKELNWLKNAAVDSATQLILKAAAHQPKALLLADFDSQHMLSVARSWRHYQQLRPLTETEETQLLAFLRGQDSQPTAQSRAWRPLLAMIYAQVFEKAINQNLSLTNPIESLLAAVLKEESTKLWPQANILQTAENLGCLAILLGRVTKPDLDQLIISGMISAEDFLEFYGNPRELSGQQAMLFLGYPVSALNTSLPNFPAREPDLLGEYQILATLAAIEDPLTAANAIERVNTLILHASIVDSQALLGFFWRLHEDFPQHVVTQVLRQAPWAQSGSEHGEVEALQIDAYSFLGIYGALKGIRELKTAIKLADDIGAFPIIAAAQNGHDAVVTALLNAGAEVDRVDPESGAFALLQAAQNGHDVVVSALLNAGAEVDRVNPENGTFALLLAAQNGHDAVVTALLNAGAEVDRVDPEDGTFALLLAAQNGHDAVVTSLLNAGAEVDRINPESGAFALLLAAQNGHDVVVSALLNAGAEVDRVDPESGTFVCCWRLTMVKIQWSQRYLMQVQR